MVRIASCLLLLIPSLLLGGCSNHSDQLARAEQNFQENRYRAALDGLEDLEHHRYSLSAGERVRYDVARGMAALRLEQPREARYWLSLAREEAAQEPLALTRSMRTEIDRIMVVTDPLATTTPPSSDAGTDASAP